MVLIPWDGMKLPTEEDVFTDIFHFHPEILENMTDNTSITKEKLYFHAIYDHDPERDDERCLNRVFGRVFGDHTTDEANFFTWLQSIMVPTCNYVTGFRISSFYSESTTCFIIMLITLIMLIILRVNTTILPCLDCLL